MALAAHERKVARQGDGAAGTIKSEEIMGVLDGIFSEFKIRVKANADDFRIGFFEGSKLSRATILSAGANLFEEQWSTFSGRLKIVPGKEALARLNDYLQREHGVSITPAAIVAKMRQEDIAQDLHDTLITLEKFAGS
jgi:hypothetical protein